MSRNNARVVGVRQAAPDPGSGTSTSLGVTWVALSGMSCLVPQRFAQFTPLIVGFIL